MTPLDGDIAVILLAAGRSQRFGGEKLIAEFKGKPLWQWSAEAAEDAGFAHRYLVVGEYSSMGPRDGWTTIVNRAAAAGMGTSIATGVAAAENHRRVVITLADMPQVTAAHLRRLAQTRGTTFTRQRDGRAGSPAAFDRERFAALRTLTGDRGARSLALAPHHILTPDDPAILRDIDTPGDMALDGDRGASVP